MKYNTNQRKILLDAIEGFGDESFSAKNLFEKFNKNEISLSAIYRNLTKLRQEKLIVEVGRNEFNEGVFKYNNSKDCVGKIHMQCENCGKVFHLDSKCAHSLERGSKLVNNFELNTAKTILYGVCKDCKVGNV